MPTFVAVVLIILGIAVIAYTTGYDRGIGAGQKRQPEFPEHGTPAAEVEALRLKGDAYCHDAADLLELLADMIDSRELRLSGRLSRKVKAREESLSSTAINAAHQLRRVGLAPAHGSLRIRLHDAATAAGDPTYCDALRERAIPKSLRVA